MFSKLFKIVSTLKPLARFQVRVAGVLTVTLVGLVLIGVWANFIFFTRRTVMFFFLS